MNFQKPDFKLARLADEDSCQAPGIVPVSMMTADTQINRRNFLGTSIGAAAALFILGYESAVAGTLAYGARSPLGTYGTGVTVLSVTPDGKNLISVSDSDTISLWSLPEGQLLHTTQVDKRLGPAHRIIASPGHSHEAQADPGQFMLLALSEGLFPPRLRGRLAGEKVDAMTATPDGKRLACASGNRIEVWSLSDDHLLATRRVRGGDAKVLAMTSDGSRLVAGSSDGTILEWYLGGQGERWLTGQPGNGRHALIITQGEQQLALADDERVSDSGSPAEVGANEQALQPAVQALALTPDGETLSVGYSNGVILLWGLVQSRGRGTRRGTRRRCRGCPVGTPPSRARGRRITVPCTPTPVPAGMICECNCVRMR